MTAPHQKPPIAMLAELTHRCPLSCPYCSNPIDLARKAAELSTADWARVFREAAALGVLQLHLSGGEPAARRDLVDLVAAAREAGLYTNLITSGIGLTEKRLAELDDVGLDHVQLSLQGTDAAMADQIGGYRGGFDRKLATAAAIGRLGLPLTLNFVMHRRNMHQLPRAIELAVEMGARRIEVATVQFHGWAERNRGALMPTHAQAAEATATVAAARTRLRGRLVIDYVPADYHASYPKPCMGGLGLDRSQCRPRRHGSSVPRRADDPGPGLRVGAGPAARRDLGEGRRLRSLPRHRLDAGALPLVRAQEPGFRRLPLPGDGARGRCGGDRPRLRQVAIPRRADGAGPGLVGGGRASGLSDIPRNRASARADRAEPRQRRLIPTARQIPLNPGPSSWRRSVSARRVGAASASGCVNLGSCVLG